jgi:hypothetical protein
MKKVLKEDIVELAKRTIYSTELLIKQCNNWLSEEEGIQNMEKRIFDRSRREKN